MQVAQPRPVEIWIELNADRDDIPRRQRRECRDRSRASHGNGHGGARQEDPSTEGKEAQALGVSQLGVGVVIGHVGLVAAF